ncbi:zinc finger CCHC domain-containing protein 13 [Striga asiatica]|uniref:Zinc finger CCHC domain-containing protein 13 n=1 Tax=Striga asiatica TaxID=4170 RepID=A0A5A7QL69_STRAF|nr:zinc finger CCHC domain-containing protein 13 [Striga asiatica]
MRIGDGHTGGGRDSHVSSHVAGFSPQMSGSKPDHPGSGGVPNSGGGRQRVCYNCGKSGHLAASCFEVLGYPDWYPRGGAGRRGGRRGRGGRGGGAPAQANGEPQDGRLDVANHSFSSVSFLSVYSHPFNLSWRVT